MKYCTIKVSPASQWAELVEGAEPCWLAQVTSLVQNKLPQQCAARQGNRRGSWGFPVRRARGVGGGRSHPPACKFLGECSVWCSVVTGWTVESLLTHEHIAIIKITALLNSYKSVCFQLNCSVINYILWRKTSPGQIGANIVVLGIYNHLY